MKLCFLIFKILLLLDSIALSVANFRKATWFLSQAQKLISFWHIKNKKKIFLILIKKLNYVLIVKLFPTKCRSQFAL